MTPAICIVGHGSRDSQATDEFLETVSLCRDSRPSRIVEYGFLEFARPLVQDGFDRCAERGAESIVVLPGMLMAAGHSKNDIPAEIREGRARHPRIEFRYGRHLHLHPKIIDLCRIRIEEAEASTKSRPREETLLLVAGRGGSDPDANSDVQKLTRMLWEGLGFGWAETCFSGVAKPLVPEALDRCRRLGFPRIVVFPFFLFTGVLEKRVRRETREFSALHPDIECVCADYLKPHPLLRDVFADRAVEAIRGEANMNCDLCMYRVRLAGHEAALGSPQFGHHHHVRGIGQDDEPPARRKAVAEPGGANHGKR